MLLRNFGKCFFVIAIMLSLGFVFATDIYPTGNINFMNGDGNIWNPYDINAYHDLNIGHAVYAPRYFGDGSGLTNVGGGTVTWADLNLHMVPYIGATRDVNLNFNDLNAKSITALAFFGSGVGLTGILSQSDVNANYYGILDVNRIFHSIFDLNIFYYKKADMNAHFQGKVDLNANFYGKLDTNTTFVPYIGAERDVNLGVYNLKTNDLNALKIYSTKFISHDANSAYGRNAVALGSDTTAFGDYSTALGWNTTASGTGSVAIGYTLIASGVESTALGNDSSAHGDFSVAIGNNDTVATGSSSIAIGIGAMARADASIVIGSELGGWATNGVTLGPDVNIARDLNVMRDLNVVRDVNVKGGVAATAFFGSGAALTGIPSQTDVNAHFHSIIDLNNFFYRKTDVNANFYGKLDVNAHFAPIFNPTFLGVAKFPNGEQANPSIAFTSNSGTGIWSDGSSIDFSVDSTQYMRIDNFGNVVEV